nr:SpoIID/LytB domain-containing protein [uncultured Blautia sp.]
MILLMVSGRISAMPVMASEDQGSVMVRVLLTDTDFRSVYHPSVTVFYNEKEYTWTEEQLKKTGETIHIPEQKEGIQILSIERQQGKPVYRGTLDIQWKSEGLILVNKLPLEEYLCSVVPGEMPASYEGEALKAQAVCARTYAWKQIQQQSLDEYGADVDDSVNYQVYGNSQPQASATEAVNATEGRIITQNGEAVEAYYFSTSAGVTVTDEVWGAETPASYLKSVPCRFDENMPWSRWQVKIPWETLAERAAKATGEKSKLLSLSAEKTDQNGAVTGLRVITETASVLLENEHTIREFLSPEGLDITEKDGTVTRGGSLLPSVFIQIEEDGKEVTITGKGYGHGVGMSQNGANAMAKEGYSWQEILDYFFRNIEIQDMKTLDSQTVTENAENN